MADTVEIQNVGGLRGVASEATLLELRDAIVAQNRGGSSSGNSRLSSSLQDAYNRSLRDSNNEQSRFTKLLYTAGRGLKELAFGGNRASDFSDAIFGAGSSISILTSYLDDNIDTWRELSSVGASFNNSIFDMIGSAANSGMELDQYSAFIRKNSEIMKVFGGTTTLGAKRVGELSKNLRSSELGGRLFEMGFTINDINEGLVNYVDLQVRLGRSETLNTKNLTQATAEYMTDLDALAKVTGKTREEFASIANQIAVDGRIRALAARASQDGADNLTKNLASATAMLPGLGETILNISSGFIGNDDMAKALETSLGPAGREFSNLIKNAGNITQDEFVDKMAKVGPALSDYLKSIDPTTLAFLKTQPAVAGALSSLADMGYQFDQMGMANSAAAREEQARTSKITGTLSKFEQAVIDLRKKFVDFFYDLTMQEGGLFDALSGLGDVVKELTSPSANGLAGLGTSFMTFAKNMIGELFGKDGYVTVGIRVFTTWLKSGGLEVFVEMLKESIASVTTWFSELGDDISNKGFWNTFKERIFDLGNWIKELFLGSTVTEMTQDGPQEVRTEGLLEKIQEYIFGDELTRPGDSLYDRFIDWVGLDSRSDESLLSQVYDRFIDWVGLDSRSDESLLSQVYNKVLDAFLGKEVMGGREDDRKLERQGGLFADMADAFMQFWEGPYGKEMANKIIDFFANAFTNFWEGPTGTNLKNTIAGYFQSLLDLMQDMLADWIPGLGKSSSYYENIQSKVDAGTATAEEKTELADKIRQDQATEIASQTNDMIVQSLGPVLGTIYDYLPLGETGSYYGARLRQELTDWLSGTTPEDILNPTATPPSPQPEGVTIDPTAGYANGTNGFQNFGSGTMAMLHNSEAVVPRNTAAGDLLQSFYDFQNKKVAAVTSTPMASDNQSSLIKKVEELNTTMMRVAELLQSSVGLQAKTVKGVKGLGSDFYRGIGR